jgi:murein L,D-transpeptidase YcbB/YkuD
MSFTERFQAFGRTSTLAAAMLLLSASLLAAQARLVVDLSERELYVYSGGDLVNTFPVAIGTEAHPTPGGEFTIDRIIWNPTWVPPDSEWARGETRKEPGDPDNPMQGAKLYFRHPAYYIHGTNAPASLGERASHGCVRMSPADVENLAEWVQKRGGADRGEAWFREVRASDTDLREVTLPDPVPLTIRS